MPKTAGLRDPATAFPLPATRDDVQERRDANRAVTVSATGLALTGIAELLVAILTGSAGLLGDAIHNLSDVSTSAVAFLGFRLSRKPPTERYPYGLERAEDLAGAGIAVGIWASAAFAGYGLDGRARRGTCGRRPSRHCPGRKNGFGAARHMQDLQCHCGLAARGW